MNKTPLSIFDFLEKTPLGRLNLRAKLTLGNMVIIFIAILGMGYYVYFRIRESNATLTTQLETNVRSRAEDSLLTSSKEQAALLNSLFASIGKDTATLGSIQESMFSQEALLNSGMYWDASTSLSRLPSGNWDNSNAEIASVFMPANAELTDALVSKLNVIKQIELMLPSIFAGNPDIVAIYFGGVSRETIYYPNIDLAAIVPPDFDVTGRPWFIDAAPAQNPQGNVVWSTPYQDAALHGLVITTSVPVLDSLNIFQGVTAMDIQLTQITSLVSSIRVGESGYAFLVDSENRLIALPESGYAIFGVTEDTLPLGEILDSEKLPDAPAEFFDILNRMIAGGGEVTIANLGGIEYYIAYQKIPEVQYSLAIIVPSEELLREAAAVSGQIAEETRNTIRVSLLLVIIVFVATSLASLGIGTRLTSPLKSLTRVANEIIAGNFNAKADIRSGDEIGTLSETLNLMTTTLRDLIQSLEQRVAERTSELEKELQKEERRERQYEAIAKVAQAINTAQNLHELLPHIADVVSRQFGFYHVGIFLNDASNRYAVLGAANSEGGRRMLNRGHQLRVGEQGIVGYVTGSGNPRIARDVGADVAFFNNPDLPNTHSEMALPLIVSGKIIGALDVQSMEVNAFTNEDVEVLSTLADQVSIAIQNARLYDQTQKSLSEAEAIYRQYFRETWSRLPQDRKIAGFRYTASGATPLEETNLPSRDAMEERQTVSVPIILRGETVGTLSVLVPKQEQIKADQMDLIKAVAERVALSAENARLFEETTRRAEQERIISDIAAKIGTSVRTESILKTTARELSKFLEGADILIELKTNNDTKEDQ
jgi:GAF domain-containing protein/HAMP domain-containing protein